MHGEGNMLKFPSCLRSSAMLLVLTALSASATDTVPQVFRNIAAKHDLSSEDLHAWAMAQTGRIDTSGKMVVWPWTVRVNGHRYQFKSRSELHAYLMDAQKSAQGDIAFGFDNHRLGSQSATELWAELEPDAMLIRAALKLSGKATNTGNKPFIIMPALLPEMPAAQGGKTGKYDALIEQVAQEVGIDPVLLHVVIRKESAYKSRATSHAGAMGLMQLMPNTAKSLGLTPEQYYEPYANLKGGARYLKRQLQTFGSLDLALAAYNAGPGNVKKYGYKIPPFAETRDYVATITARYTAAKKRQNGQAAIPVADIVDTPVTAPRAARKPQGKIIYPATRAQLADNRPEQASVGNAIRPSLFRVNRSVLAKADTAPSVTAGQGGVR